jgi:hypothetical protein
LSLDDIVLYRKYKDYPVSAYEMILKKLRCGTAREQLAVALEYKLDLDISKPNAGPYSRDVRRVSICNEILKNAGSGQNFGEEYVKYVEDAVKSVLQFGPRKNHFVHPEYKHEIERLALESRNKRSECKVTFDKILKHRTLEFFKIACEEDAEKKDWALVNVEPTRFDLLKLLFDNGAKIHKTVERVGDDGWGYSTVYKDDVPDEIATAIRREEISRLLGVEK